MPFMRLRLNFVTIPSLVLLAGCVATPREAVSPWRQGAFMPTARSELAVAALDGRIYVAGGIGRFGTSDAFEVYDPKKNAWARLAPLPMAAKMSPTSPRGIMPMPMARRFAP